jgi:hypothetical protein
MVAILLVSVGLYGSNMNQIYAQNQALSQSGNSEAEQEIEQAQSLSQDAQCVSGDITALSCNNLGLQVQRNGDDNGGEEPPVPPVDVGCPDNTVWDVTVREPAEEGGVPVDTVICLQEGLGNHPGATVIEPNGDEYVTNVNANQPNVANCNAPEQQRAQVTSGIPPNPLNMGSFVCVDVTPV